MYSSRAWIRSSTFATYGRVVSWRCGSYHRFLVYQLIVKSSKARGSSQSIRKWREIETPFGVKPKLKLILGHIETKAGSAILRIIFLETRSKVILPLLWCESLVD